MPKELREIRFVFFGSSRFSEFVLEKLKQADLFPLLDITSAKEPLPSKEDLEELNADVFIVASFGKILPKWLLDIPKYGCLNVHPSLLPELRGPAPIQNLILGKGTPGVTIIKMDEEMDHGPIIAAEEVPLEPFPDHYEVVEEKLATKGGELLAKILPEWINGEMKETVQDESKATFVKMIKKEDGLLNLDDAPELNMRKVMAYSHWPTAYFFFKTKGGQEKRVVVKDAEIIEGKFTPKRVVPEGKKEMSWPDFLRGNA